MANGIRAEYAKRAEANTIRQDDLFGADETFNTEMALRAKYAGDQIAKINLDLRALKIVSGKQSGNVAAKDSLLKKYNIKGPDDSAGIERAIQELETLHHRWQHYYTDAELSKEADAFVKKSLRLDPEDQPPVVIVQPDANDSRFTIHDSPAGQSPASPAAQQQGRGATPHQPDQASNPPSLQTSGGEAASPLGSPAAQPADSATQRSAEPPENAVRRKIQDVQVRIGEPWMNEGMVNGPRFTDTAKPIDKKTQRTTLRENVKTPMRNDWMGDKHGSTSIASNVNAGKITEWEATENPHAHKYAAENLNELWAKARVAVRHIDKDIARRAEEQGLDPKDIPQKHFLRAYTPFVFQGKLYVAVISKRDIDHDVPGVHAIEVDAVIDADRIPDFLSGPTGTERIDGWTRNSETQSAPTDTVAKPGKKVKPPSANSVR